MSEDKTTRTDAIDNETSHNFSATERSYRIFVFARTLELELNAANKQIAMDTVRFKEMQKTRLRREVELNEVNEEADYWQKEHEAQRKLNVELSTQLTTAQQEITQLKLDIIEIRRQHNQEVREIKPDEELQQEISELKQLLELMKSAASGNKKDKERLDWMQKQSGVAVGHKGFSDYENYFCHWKDAPPLRQAIDSAIDSAMKGTKE